MTAQHPILGYRDRARRFGGLWLAGILLTAGIIGGCASEPRQPAPVDTAAVERDRAEASVALETAHRLVKDAKALGWDATSVEPLLKQAENAFAKGEYRQAAELAATVQQLALTGTNRRQLILAREALDAARGLTGLTPELLAQIDAVDKAITGGDGPRALALARELLGALQAAKIHYRVVRGDSLWGISGKPDIYADPYRWPLIYKANRSQIKDPDLIYPDQQFDIDKHPSQGDVDTAVDHARHRGSWSIGTPEASDESYLGR